ncbi:hypothetical protein EB795_07415 [Pseudomonas mandelii]|nr:hypothetical protein [Pseudomonas mandelii]
MSDRHREQAHSHKGSGVERKGCGITNQTVGASLLAIAECQATEMSDFRPTSRAGSLPQMDAITGRYPMPVLQET